MRKINLDFLIVTICFLIDFVLSRISNSITSKISVILFLALILGFAIYLSIKYKKNKLFIIAAALCFAADIFLTLIRNGSYVTEAGLTCFVFAQTFYALYLHKEGVNHKKILKLVRIVLLVLLPIVAFIIFRETTNYIIIATSIYAVLLVMNIVESFFLQNKNLFLIIGFILFFMCDFNLMFLVGKQMSLFDASNIPVLNLAFIIPDSAWLFYIPAHYCLASSLIKFDKPQLSDQEA